MLELVGGVNARSVLQSAVMGGSVVALVGSRCWGGRGVQCAVGGWSAEWVIRGCMRRAV